MLVVHARAQLQDERGKESGEGIDLVYGSISTTCSMDVLTARPRWCLPWSSCSASSAQLLASGVPRAAESAPRTLHLDLLGPTRQPCTACQHRMNPRCFAPNIDFAHMQCERHSHSVMSCCRQLESRGQVGLRLSQSLGACIRHRSADASVGFNVLFLHWLTPIIIVLGRPNSSDQIFLHGAVVLRTLMSLGSTRWTDLCKAYSNNMLTSPISFPILPSSICFILFMPLSQAQNLSKEEMNARTAAC